jgi:hypothetical protein
VHSGSDKNATDFVENVEARLIHGRHKITFAPKLRAATVKYHLLESWEKRLAEYFDNLQGGGVLLCIVDMPGEDPKTAHVLRSELYRVGNMGLGATTACIGKRSLKTLFAENRHDDKYFP